LIGSSLGCADAPAALLIDLVAGIQADITLT
jgi:hypothetical protein